MHAHECSDQVPPTRLYRVSLEAAEANAHAALRVHHGCAHREQVPGHSNGVETEFTCWAKQGSFPRLQRRRTSAMASSAGALDTSMHGSGQLPAGLFKPPPAERLGAVLAADTRSVTWRARQVAAVRALRSPIADTQHITTEKVSESIVKMISERRSTVPPISTAASASEKSLSRVTMTTPSSQSKLTIALVILILHHASALLHTSIAHC